MAATLSIILIFAVGAVAIFFVMRNAIAKNKERIAKIKQIAQDNGFANAQQYGGNIDNIWSGSSALLLYVDNSRKKWLLMSADVPEHHLCKDFGDLVGYDFYDKDGIDFGQAMLNFAIGVGKAGIGLSGLGFYSSGALAGLLGLSATAALANKIPYIKTAGVTKAYGIIVKTMDCSEDKPFYVFDIPTLLYIKGNSKLTAKIGGAIGAIPRYGHQSGPYKKDIAAINEIFGAFDKIMQSA